MIIHRVGEEETGEEETGEEERRCKRGEEGKTYSLRIAENVVS